MSEVKRYDIVGDMYGNCSMTDITKLAQNLKAAADREMIFRDVAETSEIWERTVTPENILALVEALEMAQQAPSMPLGLHPDTQKLVAEFCTALAGKLYKAQLKYGYDTDWKQDWWQSQCQAKFYQHIAKGDPRDVAAYCAFMWWHGWSTKTPESLESRTFTVSR